MAFPPFGHGDLAFVAIVPMLLVVRAAPPRRAAFLGFVFGCVFWLIDLSWLWSLKDNGGPVALVGLGHVALSLFLSLFQALFAFAVAASWRLAKKRPMTIIPILLVLVAEPVFWVGSEYLRGVVLTGFPWDPLAATQYGNPAFLHPASWAGACAVSFLLVAINSSIASTISRLLSTLNPPLSTLHSPLSTFHSPLSTPHSHLSSFIFHLSSPRLPVPRIFKWPVRSLELFIALCVTVACWMRGLDAIGESRRVEIESPRLRAAVVCADMPSIFEKDEEALDTTSETLLSHAELAAMASPDICVWPETILPGYIPYDRDAADLVRGAVSALDGAALLAGGVELQYGGAPDDDVPNPHLIYNSAFLFGPKGIMATYRKRHLVPFGEFIPLESKLRFLKRLAPAGFSCEPGDAAAVCTIHTPRGEFMIGPLICFEDAFPSLARDSVRNGADVLALLANDAWFAGSAEGEQHLAQAVLRCVENGRPMMRATNRGVSALIDGHGRIVRRIGGDGSGAGFAVGDLAVVSRRTIYTRFGDWLLGIPCAILLIAFAVLESSAWKTA